MTARSRLVALIIPFAVATVSSRDVGAPQTTPDAVARLQRVAAGATHFATGDIIRNRFSESRWPAGLLEEQQRLLEDLRAASGERDALLALLRHADSKMRTLALGALFIREDPRDLPLIAALTRDTAATIPLLQKSFDSRGGEGRSGELPLSFFESPQTVGAVAQAMIGFYLDAARESSTFEEYWAARAGRVHSASWFLVKMRRATRRVSPRKPQYEDDVRRVLAEIDALPPAERAWTLLYVRTDETTPDYMPIPDAEVAAALRSVGPDTLLKFLRRERFSDDPDLRPAAGRTLRADFVSGMVRFVLDHAPDLLRPSDAGAVLAGADGDPFYISRFAWVAAAARLRALEDGEKAAASIRNDLTRPPGAMLAQADQAILATALWQMRGAAERAFLANWFHTALPTASVTFPPSHGPVVFLRSVDKEARPDTTLLLAAIVRESRFDQTDWASLSQILQMVNKTLPNPLVDVNTIYNYSPPSSRRDQPETLAAWRTLLRQHFGPGR